MEKITKTLILLAVTSAAGFLLLPVSTQAATLSLRPSLTQVAVGKNFTVRVMVDSQGKVINNAEAVVNFPTDLAEAVSASSAGSIFSLWVEAPAYSNSTGRVSANGGIPNPGYKGSGQFMTITFRAKKAGQAKFSLTGAAVRENDGLGTNILSGVGGTTVTIAGATPPVETPKEEAPKVTAPSTSGATNIPATITISSPTHPDSSAWYSSSHVIFVWQLPPGISASETLFDNNPNGQPTVRRQPAASSVTISDVKDGVWYLHARFLNAQGWSKVYTFKIQVDTTPPTNIQAPITRGADQQLTARLTASDALSQVAYYSVQVDSQEAIRIPTDKNQASFILPALAPGSHNLTVIAYDQAGNSTPITTEIQPSAQVSIIKYPTNLNSGGRITISGIGPANSDLKVTLTTAGGFARYYLTATTADGLFSFQTEPIGTAGNYILWVEPVNNPPGQSLASSKVVILVKPLIPTEASIKPMEVTIILLNTIIALLSLFLLFSWYKYLRLRKFLKNLAKNVQKTNQVSPKTVKVNPRIVKNITKNKGKY